MLLVAVYLLLFQNYITVTNAECLAKESVQGKIKKFILSCYDKDTRPVISHTNVTRVKLLMKLRYFNYDDHSYTMTVDAWLPMMWNDHHLTWDPNDYEGVKEIFIDGNEIWTPDVSLFNKGDLAVGPHLFEQADCHINFDGDVTCLPLVEMEALCVPDITYWPYDTQTCKLAIGSWAHRGDEIDFEYDSRVISGTFTPNAEWMLVNKSVERLPNILVGNNSYPTIVFTFNIKRHSGAATATCVLPALALMIMILLTIWLDPKSSDRIYLSALNIPCHLLYIQHITWEIAYNGDTIANIILFFRDSMFLGVLLLAETLLVRYLLNVKISAPSWLSTFLNLLVNNKIGRIFILTETIPKGSTNIENDEDGSNLVGDDRIVSQKEWFILATFLDKICLLIYIIVYFSLLIVYLPK